MTSQPESASQVEESEVLEEATSLNIEVDQEVDRTTGMGV